jgi:hypothetical protein
MDTATLEKLKPWATPIQSGYIDAIIASDGNVKKAAELLDRHPRKVQEAIARVRLAAAGHGFSPEHGLNSPVPAPFIAKGHSTLERVELDGSRTPVLQWTKTRLDDHAWADQIKLGVEAMLADIEPRELPAAPLIGDRDLIPWIQIGDAHLGMLAHEAETGANFDLKIAEAELMGAIDILIDDLPEVERLVINDLGDFTHYENMAGVTEHSRNVLDYDGRFPKMIEVYSRMMRGIIEKALTKAAVVDVIVNQGNHSRTNDIWMAVLLRALYEGSGRVNVLNNRSPFIGYRMGNTFVMTHHSDTCKPARLASVMATDFARDWGECDYRYIDIGHIHHGMVLKEHPGVVIESFNQLAAKDKWATDGGYRSRQSISMIYRSRTYGEIGRRLLPLRQVQDRIRMTATDHYVAPERRAFTV